MNGSSCIQLHRRQLRLKEVFPCTVLMDLFYYLSFVSFVFICMLLNMRQGFSDQLLCSVYSQFIITSAKISITEGFDSSEDVLTVWPPMILEMIMNGSIPIDASSGINVTQLPVNLQSSTQAIGEFVNSVLDMSSLEVGPHSISYNAEEVCVPSRDKASNSLT